MNKLTAILKTVRPVNLLILFVAQHALHYLIFIPIMELYGKFSTLDPVHFFLLSLTTVLIAASGYIINDYYDVDIDIINKPDKVIVGKILPQREAYYLHLALNVVAIIIGFYLSWVVGNIKLGFIFPVISGVLWFYANSYKKQFLIGNLVIAGLTAMAIFIVGLFESIIFDPVTASDMYAVHGILLFSFGYTIFSFLISLIREIIKDMEDVKGDKAYGANTLPVILGATKTKIAIIILGILLIVGIIFIQTQKIVSEAYETWMYLFATLQIPLLFMIYHLIKARSKEDYRQLSNITKAIMILGVGSMGYFYYLIKIKS